MVATEYSITTWLPNDGQRVMAYGFRTFCCVCDMEKERDWHEVVFSFGVTSYKLKREVPHDLEESILAQYECREQWEFDDQEPFDHLIGVTKWKKLERSK